MIWPTVLELDGVPFPLAGVLADLTIRHGRAQVDDGPVASSMTITLEPVARELTAAFKVGRPIRLLVSDAPLVGTFLVGERLVGGTGPRFVGTVTDAELDDDRLALTAIGPLAAASRVALDLTGWPVEPWSARCARVFAAAGVPARVEPDPAYDPLLEVPVEQSTGTLVLGTYLPSLAAAVGAAICDGPDGVIVCQALGSRSSRASALIELDPARVAYVPAWHQTLEVTNDVTVQYGNDQAVASVRATDVASMNEYGPRATAIEQTRLSTQADALTRARVSLSRSAYPRWGMPAAPVLSPLFLAVGDRVQVSELPPSSPYPTWAPLLEGWTDRIDGPDWTIDLSLSDPILSGLALTWADLAAAPALPWTAATGPWWEAVSLDAIGVA
jgi:hypothetical protein